MPIWYGGDYNPEQWPRAVWDEDVMLMQQGGITLATVGVFAWAKLEPREGEFDFDWLDLVMDKLHDGGIRVDLATATASPPPWLTHNHPEVLPVTEEGVRLRPGSRQQYCASSPIYRRLAARLVSKITERYKNHPALELWHINNEYGCHVSHCYCDVSADAFRGWLESKYSTIEALNSAWGTAFWSQQYGDFADVYPPSAAPTFRNPTQLLDFDRFSSDELLECFRMEASIVRAASPAIPLTTNFIGIFRDADYWKWAPEVDVVSVDSYPDPADPDSAAYAGMTNDLMRSLGGGKPWLLMEQAPSAVNWRNRNAAKQPGQMRAGSYQALARGADGILFFQWRQAESGAEKFHSALIPHAGVDTRVWREVVQLGSELRGLDAVAGGGVPASVAIVFEWDSWWTIEQSGLPADLNYVRGAFAWYQTLFDLNITVDFVRADHDLSRYAMVLVPSLFSASAVALENLAQYARQGGVLLVTYQTGIVDEDARITAGGYLGVLQGSLGIRVEEFAPPAAPNLWPNSNLPVPTLQMSGAIVGSVESTLWSEFVNERGAEVVARFSGGMLDGWPAITRNSTGRGEGWYVATMPDTGARAALVEHLLRIAKAPRLNRLPVDGVEVVARGAFVFIINHGNSVAHFDISGLIRDPDLSSPGIGAAVQIPPFGVACFVNDGESLVLITDLTNLADMAAK